MPQEGIKPLSTDKKNTKEGTLVLPKEDTIVYGAEKSKVLETGKEYVVHAIHAEKLVKKGEAVYEKPKKA